MGTILVPLFTHYRPAAPLVQAAYAEGLRIIVSRARFSAPPMPKYLISIWPTVRQFRDGPVSAAYFLIVAITGAHVVLYFWGVRNVLASSQSVREHHAGLHSFRSMRRMEARRRKARALWSASAGLGDAHELAMKSDLTSTRSMQFRQTRRDESIQRTICTHSARC